MVSPGTLDGFGADHLFLLQPTAQQALQAGKGFVREFMRDRNYALGDSALGARKPQPETCR